MKKYKFKRTLSQAQAQEKDSDVYNTISDKIMAKNKNNYKRVLKGDSDSTNRMLSSLSNLVHMGSVIPKLP